MRSFRHSSNLALLTIIAFLTTISFNPMVTSCGGGGGGGGGGDNGGGNDGNGGEEGVTFGTVQTATSDANGAASIVGTVSSKTINFTLQGTEGRPVSGLNLEYVEATDKSAALAIISGSGYQTTSIVLESSDLSSEGAEINVKAYTASGEDVDFFIITAATIVYITLVLLTAKTIYDICKGVYELYGDPPDLSLYGGVGYACLSPAQILNGVGLAYNTYSLLTMGSLNAAKTAVQEGSKKVLEVVGPELLVEGTVEVATETLGVFADWMAASTDTGGMGYDRNTHYCVELYNNLTYKSQRYTTAANVSGLACTDSNGQADATICTGSAVVAARATTPTEGQRDRDKDGYYEDAGGDGFTPGTDDCNDGDPKANPGVIEICGNGTDDDCSSSDGQTDTACASNIEIDLQSPCYTDPSEADEQHCACQSWDDTLDACATADRALIIEADIAPDAGMEISDNAEAYFIINGHARRVQMLDHPDPTSNHKIASSFALIRCDAAGYVNQWSVVLDNGDGNYAVKEIVWVCNDNASELLVMLFWDQCETDGTEVDLYIKEPGDTFAYEDMVDADGATNGLQSPAGGTFDKWGHTCYGPVYYQTANAPDGTYQIRIHYKDGDSQPNYALYVIANEGFDDAQIFTGQLLESDAAATGTGYFNQSHASWSTDTWMVTKSGNYWMSGGY